MPSAEQKLSFHRKLKKEIELWLKENIITPEQKEQILARYKILKEADEKAGPGKLITTISILGSVLVGIGIILFIASNWSEIPRWGKLFIIFSSMLTSYGFGFYLCYERENYPKIGAALILLGSIIFGAGIFLIAQIYHISVHYPNGPLMWGLGVLPLAYLLRLKTLLTLSIIDLLIWLGIESSFWVPGFFITPFITLFFIAGITLWGIGLMHSGFKSFKMISGPYIVSGIFAAFICGFILTFDELFRVQLGSEELLVFYGGMVGLFLLSILLYLLSKDKEKGWLPEIISMIILMGAVVSLSLFYKGTDSARDASNINTIVLTSNLIFAVAIIGILFLGYIRHNKAYINIGLLFFALDVFARYFDFFWKLLPRSLFFIAGGIMLLIGGVILERKRRQVLASFKIEEAS